MKNSIFLSLPLFLFMAFEPTVIHSPFTLSDPLSHESSIIKTDDPSGPALTNVCESEESLAVEEKDERNQRSNDPVLDAFIFEYCSKQCGDPRNIENAPCWFQCRYTIYLLSLKKKRR